MGCKKTCLYIDLWHYVHCNIKLATIAYKYNYVGSLALTNWPLLLCFGCSVFQCIQNIALEKLLIRHPHLNWVARWTVFTIPKNQIFKTLTKLSDEFNKKITITFKTTLLYGELHISVYICERYFLYMSQTILAVWRTDKKMTLVTCF